MIPFVGVGFWLKRLQNQFAARIMTARNPFNYLIFLLFGDPGRTRTSDLQLRRLLLYPLSYGAVHRT